MANTIVWFDIPTTDLKRATQFYSSVLAVSIEINSEYPMAIFEHQENSVGGCLYQDSDVRPSDQGPLLYFNVNGRLDEALALVESNCGKIVQPKHAIGPYGFRAVVLDSEGNRIALHSETD